MPVARTASLSFAGPADALAVAQASALGQGVITPAEATANKLKRAKERIYVLFQVLGWGVFLATQIVFSQAFSKERTEPASPTNLAVDLAVIAMVALSGLLLTHYVRPLMTRLGWKKLSWLALVPRVLGMAALLSFAWNALGFGYIYGVVELPWTSKHSLWLIFSVSSLQGTAMFVGWLCIYFFYHVYERLNLLQVEQLKLAANVKEAELRALKSQVNPHFLFNSLNSLRALIDEDAPRAREAVTRLSNMLRYSLQSGQLETVPFEDELRIVEDYLALETIRHEERLRVRWEISPDARLVSVPPMLLQTLVENAVKYGISTRREGGEIAIAARLDGAALNIRVTNPGNLDAPSSAAAARAGSSTGVGLRNASERLKLLFGDRATLAVRSEQAGFVTADVLIPLNSPVA